MDEVDIEKVKRFLDKNLSRDRFFHSLEVAKVAQRLAKIHKCVHPKKAYLAGLVHDLARDLQEDELTALAKKFRLKIDAFTKKYPMLLHASVAAKLAKKKLGIYDKEILQAIEKHCAPKVYMSRLDKIIFLADIIAPTPKIWSGSKKISDLAKRFLDKALLCAYNENLKSMAEKNKKIHPDLIKSRNHLLENLSKRILILGARGMLGSALRWEFRDHHLTCWDKKDVNITNRKELQEMILKLKPDLIINAAGYTNVEKAESEQQKALKVNGKAVGYLATIAKKIDASLVHYSTDYVFDGKNRKGYKENAQPNPINVYGKSKFLGEALLRRGIEKYYLIRSSWMFGKKGIHFVDKMLQLSKGNDTLRVVNDQWGKPTYARDLAYRTKQLIEQDKPFGIYHITNEGKTTWYQYAKKIFELAQIEQKVKPVSSRDFKTKAKRPLYSALLNTKLLKLRRWEEALEEYLND